MKFKKLLTFFVAASAFLSLTHAQANDLSKDIFVSDAWVQAMPPSQKITAAYMTIANNSKKEIILLSASSDIAAATEIHQMSEMDGMMKMDMTTNVHIPAQGKMILQPGGYHIMLINLKKPIKNGGMVCITLNFQDAGSIIVNAQVKMQTEEKSSNKPGMM